MSTKNLARTVIEGGRDHYSRFFRRHSNAVERTRTHQLERQLCSTLEPEDAYSPHGILRHRQYKRKKGSL